MAYYPPRPITPLAGEYTIYNRYVSEYLSPQKNLSTLFVVVYPSSLKESSISYAGVQSKSSNHICPRGSIWMS